MLVTLQSALKASENGTRKIPKYVVIEILQLQYSGWEKSLQKPLEAQKIKRYNFYCLA